MDIVHSIIGLLIVPDYSMVIKHLETNSITNLVNKVGNIIVIDFIDSMATTSYSDHMDNIIIIMEDIRYNYFNFIN